MYRLYFAIFALIIALALGTGCGDDSDSSSPSSANTTGAQQTTSDGSEGAGKEGDAEAASFIEEANEVCLETGNQMRKDFEPLFKERASGPEPEVWAQKVVDRVVAPGFEQQVRDLRALTPPPDQTKDFDATLASIQAMVAEAEDNPLAFISSNSPFTTATKAADKQGLSSCGRL